MKNLITICLIVFILLILFRKNVLEIYNAIDKKCKYDKNFIDSIKCPTKRK